MTDQPALFETVITPYGATYAPAPASHGAAYGQGEHAAVTAPEHAEDIDRRFDAWLRANPHVLDEFVQRALAYQRAGYRTLRGATGVPLDVHHLTYERRGDERYVDLKAICRACHTQVHHQEDK